MWKKWMVVGASAGVGFAALSAAVIGVLTWYSSREVPWNTEALSVVWSEAEPIRPEGWYRPATWRDIARFRAGEPTRPLTVDETDRLKTLPDYAGFVLGFAVQNNTNRDITIRSDGVRIMRRLVRGGVLADAPFVEKLAQSFFIPAHQRGELSLTVDWSCLLPDANRCLSNLFQETEGLVLFHEAERIQVLLPKPLTAKERVRSLPR
jgi:hypothetical protein